MRHYWSKKIIQLKDGKVVREYPSVTSVKEYGFCRDMVSRCLSGKYKQYKGFQWVLKSDARKEKQFRAKKVAMSVTYKKEYSTWVGIRRRCRDHKLVEYPRYGGRGIIVCDRWKSSFLNFLNDMGVAPSEKHSIDRIDNNGNYEPSNCRWATFNEQCNNRRTSKFLEYNGVRKTMVQWADEYNIHRSTVHTRLRLGWTIEKVLTTPIKLKIKRDGEANGSRLN